MAETKEYSAELQKLFIEFLLKNTKYPKFLKIIENPFDFQLALTLSPAVPNYASSSIHFRYLNISCGAAPLKSIDTFEEIRKFSDHLVYNALFSLVFIDFH